MANYKSLVLSSKLETHEMLNDLSLILSNFALNSDRGGQEDKCRIQFSKNWFKAKRKVDKLDAKITNIWRNHLHQTANKIIQNHEIVCIEDNKHV